MKTVKTDTLEIAYLESGPMDGPAAILLHGFPYDIRSYSRITKALSDKGIRCLVPFLRGYGATRFLDAKTMRSGQQAALGADLLAFMDALSIGSAVLGGFDWGGRAACIVSSLWPDRVTGLVSCGQGYNIQDISNASQPASPEEEARYWYIYYFNTRRGLAGLNDNRKALCQYIWKKWSPSWEFEQATYDVTAASFENPDFVDIVIHSYRHRLGGIEGDHKYDEIEALLAKQPLISVPTIVLQGRDDGVDPPAETDLDAAFFTAAYERDVIDGVGHNLPQEAPQRFSSAVISLFG